MSLDYMSLDYMILDNRAGNAGRTGHHDIPSGKIIQ